jgi:HTH-type transcriptional regulator/antitoxin MqsA
MPKRQCMSCGFKGMVHETRDLPFVYRGETRTVSAVRGWYCPECGDGEPDDAAAYAQAIDKLAAEVDAWIASDLARIRKRLKLTQQQAARITGGGANAFSRYERGQAKPLAAVVNLFRLLDRHPELLDEVRPN